jgi:aminomethyltransferase
MSADHNPQALARTALHAAHLRAGGRMVGFAGYEMPVQYPEGVLAEHRWTRAHAGLFDVSHMGPAWLTLTEHPGDTELALEAISALIEPLISGDIAQLAPGGLRYTLLLGEDGGVLDDLMVGRPVGGRDQGSLYLVVTAGTKEADFARIEAAMAGRARITRADAGGLIALQGPEAAAVMAEVCPAATAMAFIRFRPFDTEFGRLVVSRSGYTGEDGFEILTGPGDAERVWGRLLADDRVRPVGLGARDSLRLEAGLPLYGHDLDPSVSPIEANLGFAVSKRRLAAGDIPGTDRLRREMAGGPLRLRAGLRVLEGAPAREGAEIVHDATVVGRVTSGGFSPTLAAPIAMGFVPPALAEPGTRLSVVVRGKPQAAEVAPLPFGPHRYVRQP